MEGNEKKQDVGRLLGIIHNGVHRRMVNTPAHREVEGMTGKNGWIIGFLARNAGHPVYQKDLEKEFNVTRSTASKVITLMEKKGFVARRGVENDARLKEIVLTEKGRMLACKMQQDIEEMEGKLTAGFSREEREQLLDFLHRIYCNLNENERNDKGERNSDKKLSAYIGEYMAATILTPLMVTLEAVMEILIPLIMADLIDKGIDTGNMSAITGYGLLLLGAALLALAFGVLSGRFAAVSSSGFAKNLRQAMFYKVQNYSFSNIDHFSTASIVTRLTTDVSNIQNAFHMMTRIAFRAPAMLIFALAASFRIDAEMSMIFVAVLPVLGLGMFLIIRKVYPIFNTVFRNYDKLNNVVQENLYAMRVVKSYNRQEHETEKFRKMSGAICRDFVTAEKNMMLSMPLMQFCMYACILLISWLGARAILASGNDAALGLSTGELLSLITYVMQILMSLMMISMIIVQLTMAKASGDRIVEILEEESDIHNPEHPVHEVKDGSVVFDHVNFAYGKGDGHRGQNALSDICLEIRSGETVGILGGTGSSKSTLVQMIPRLYDVTGGRVLVGGVDVREYDMEALRKQVAMVLQKNVLFSGTIKENLRWGNENASDEELRRVCRLACADEFIQDMEQGYDTMIEQGGTNVSGGQRQRLCIARALLAHPKILILDDSTSAVDMKTDALIRRAFAEEIPDTTKIIIAQRVASVQDADKIVVLDDGKIAAVGTHEELLASNGIYQEVYRSQNRTGLEEGGVA